MFVVEIPYFNLDQIYNSGQVPRWIVLNQSPEKSKYIIPFKDKALKIEQVRDRYDFSKYRFIMSCSEDEFFDTWFNYFDLSTDYFKLNIKIRRLGGKFKRIANISSGVHILNQDKFEAYILAKLISFVGYRDASVIINRIAEVCGIQHIQSMREAGRITWYEFPSPEMLLVNLDKLENHGKVNDWLKRLCEAIVRKNYAYTCPQNWNDICKLYMGDKSAFPLNGIKDTLVRNFGENPEEFADWYLYDIEVKGLVYMYIMHLIIKRVKEVNAWG